FRGNEIAGLPNHKISRLGLGYVPENRDIFPTLTVRQNLELGVKNPRKPGKWRAEQMLDMFPNLAQR
ncbi:MAG TPA: ABC transporter ATP-binding protein, partial [Alcanivorax sp.]|nr:ABC transporter ATP-binding protein [Alcanivorax sp.]